MLSPLPLPAHPARTRFTVHAKGNGASVEVRGFVMLGRSQWHRMGTWCLPTSHYRTTLRPMLSLWATSAGTEIDESAAAICTRDLPPIAPKPAP